MLSAILAAIKAQDYAGALAAVDECLAKRLTPTLRGRALYLKGCILLEGFPLQRGDGIAALKEALVLLRRSLLDHGKALVALCGAFSQHGDLMVATKYRDDFVALLRLNPQHEGLKDLAGICWFNYALCLEQQERFHEAKAAYLEALQASARTSRTNGEAMAAFTKHNLSYVCICLGDLAEAKSYMEAAAKALPDKLYGSKLLNRRAEFALAAGHPGAPLVHVRDALEHESLNDDTRAEVYLTWARALLDIGEHHMAADLAKKCRHFARIAKHQRVMRQLVNLVAELTVKGVAQ